MGFSKIKTTAPGTRWLWCTCITKEVRAMNVSRDLTVLRTTQTQGEKLLCAPKHFQYETQPWEQRQCISEQRGSVSQGAWQWSQRTHKLPHHILYQDHSKLKTDLIQKQMDPIWKKLQTVHSPYKLRNCIWTAAFYARPQDWFPHTL